MADMSDLADELERLLKRCLSARGHDTHTNEPQQLPAARADLENWLTSAGNGQRIVDELRLMKEREDAADQVGMDRNLGT